MEEMDISHLPRLPVEIHQLILSFLDIKSLVSAMRSYSLWNEVGENRLKTWLTAQVSEETILELNDDLSEVEDWAEIAYKMSQFPKKDAITEIVNLDMNGDIKNKEAVHLRCSGDYIFFCQQHDIFIVNYSSPDLSGAKIITTCENCLNFKLLNVSSESRFYLDTNYPDKMAFHDALVIIDSFSIYVVTVPHLNQQQLFNKYFQTFSSRALATRANQFAFYDENTVKVYEINVLSVRDSGELIVATPVICEFKSRPLRELQLSFDRVISITGTGCLNVHSIHTATIIYTCNQITNPLRYPLATVLHRGVVFCNLKMMKIMLNYWHINMGSPEWGVWSEHTDWQKFSSKIAYGEEIVALAMQQVLIVAGTNKGRIAFYRNVGKEQDICCTFKPGPLFAIEVCEGEKINDLWLCFGREKLHIFFRSNNLKMLTISTEELYDT